AHIHGDIHSFIGGQRKGFFEEALKTHGLAVREDYFAEGQYFSKEEGYGAMKTLMALEDPPTAIFCASDLLAIGAMEAIHEAGMRVPDDFSIVGFDGIDLGQLITPRLTTIKQDTEKIGHLAAKYMMEFIHGEKKPKKSKTITVETELLNGDSTKPL
ncbi:MAG: LacI family DNA-binding transcriptional regulator, partial [Bacillota bacterium]